MDCPLHVAWWSVFCTQWVNIFKQKFSEIWSVKSNSLIGSVARCWISHFDKVLALSKFTNL